VVVSEDGTVAALLGASPGASTAAAIMFGLVQKCFKEKSATAVWQQKMKEMAPSLNESLSKSPELVKATRERTSRVLKLL